MIIHVEDKERGFTDGIPGLPTPKVCRYNKVKLDMDLTPDERRFVQDRETRICPRCMGLCTRENAAFDCEPCHNTGEIEVDAITELPSAPDAG